MRRHIPAGVARPVATFLGCIAGQIAFSQPVQQALGYGDRAEPLAETIAGGLIGASLAWTVARIVWRNR